MKNKSDSQIAISKEIGRANQRSFDEARQLMRETGIRMQKIWISTTRVGDSRVPGCHDHFEKLGLMDMDYEYLPGLKFPGDPDCNNNDEISTCKCTIAFEVMER